MAPWNKLLGLSRVSEPAIKSIRYREASFELTEAGSAVLAE